MSCQIRNNANIDLTDLEPHIHGMYDHFHQKIGFQKPPVIVFDSDPSNESNVLGKTAYYDPQSFEVHVFTDARHPKDMLRSIAHELIHHGQNLEGRLDVGGYNGPGYYLKNDKLKDLEEEAMTNSAIYLREYEDGLKLKEKNKMSLKEWKNNELNQLLLKKFGILKEQKQEVEEITQKQEDNLPPEVVKAIKKKEGEDGEKEEEVEESVRRDAEESKENADGQHSTASGKSDRFKNLEENKEDEVLEEEDLDEASCGSKRYMKEEELDEMSGNANQASDRTQADEYPNGREQGRLRESIRKTLKENRAIRLRIKR